MSQYIVKTHVRTKLHAISAALASVEEALRYLLNHSIEITYLDKGRTVVRNALLVKGLGEEEEQATYRMLVAQGGIETERAEFATEEEAIAGVLTAARRVLVYNESALVTLLQVPEPGKAERPYASLTIDSIG